MPSVNKQIIVGYVGRDPEIRFVDSKGEQRMIANFSVATTERFAGRDVTEWHRCQAWGKLAEIAEKMVRKGKLIYCEGRTQTRKWTDRAGVERETKEVNLSEIRMLSKKDEGESERSAKDAEFNARVERVAALAAKDSGKAPSTPDDDLPF